MRADTPPTSQSGATKPHLRCTDPETDVFLPIIPTISLFFFSDDVKHCGTREIQPAVTFFSSIIPLHSLFYPPTPFRTLIYPSPHTNQHDWPCSADFSTCSPVPRKHTRTQSQQQRGATKRPPQCAERPGPADILAFILIIFPELLPIF